VIRSTLAVLGLLLLALVLMAALVLASPALLHM
jgi:hypothetical protein